MSDAFGFAFIVIGLAFDFFGCLGLIRMPDVYNRLQASTKCITLGTCSILLGVLFIMGISAAGLKSLLCIVFLLLTSPVSAHALARASHKAGVKLWDGSIIDKYSEDRDSV